MAVSLNDYLKNNKTVQAAQKKVSAAQSALVQIQKAQAGTPASAGAATLSSVNSRVNAAEKALTQAKKDFDNTKQKATEYYNANVDVIKGNMNAHVGKNLQSQVDGDSITKVKGNYDVNVGGDLSYNVDGKTTVYSKGDIVNKSDGNIHNNSGKDFSIKSQNYELEASQSISSKGLTQKLSSTTVNVNLTPVEFVVGIGASIFKVDSAGFGGTIQMSVPISNAYHTGCFPGPGSGPSTPYIGVATPALPVSAISTKGTLQFVESPKSSNVSTDTSKNEKDDKVDSEGNPDITSNP